MCLGAAAAPRLRPGSSVGLAGVSDGCLAGVSFGCLAEGRAARVGGAGASSPVLISRAVLASLCADLMGVLLDGC
jgi:hypothetical protein